MLLPTLAVTLALSPNPAPGAERIAFAARAPGGGAAPVDADWAAAPEYAVASGRFRLLWDAQALWVRAAVADEVRAADVTGADDPLTYADDGVELMIDADPDNVDPAATTIAHVIVSAAGGVYDVHGMTGGDPAAAEVASATVTTSAGGFVAVVRLDWQRLGVTPAGGAALGFDFGVNDRDVAGTTDVVQLDWSGLADYDQRGCWGRLQLAGEGDPAECLGGFDRDGRRCLDDGAGCAVGPGRRAGAGGAGPFTGLATALAAAALALARATARRRAGRPLGA